MNEQIPSPGKTQEFSLEDAVQLAKSSHEGQPDKGDGKPYISHPLRVMKALERYGTEVQMAAILHDVIEDTPVTLEDLRQAGASEEIIEAVDLLSKKPGEDYDKAIAQVKQNRIGKLVKLADNRDNANKKRLALFPEEKRSQLEAKYTKAIEQLIEGDEWLTLQLPLVQGRIETLYDEY